ncbi:MAG: FAD-binding oxidoreductase [Mailhella sp.]|nr:FAD-binding oxidoreductase [Mailhella sp.]
MKKNEENFVNMVREFLPWSQTHTGEVLAKVYSVDASPFEPRAFAVVDVKSLQELTALFNCAEKFGVSLTLRGAGTALSGQATAEDVAVRFTGDAWRQMSVLEGGMYVCAANGVKGGEINAALAPFGRFITSDPSSIATATIGGMTANNAAGLSCTVATNIYHAVKDICFLLADGTYVDTSSRNSVERFRLSHAGMLGSISLLRDKILASPELSETIRRKFQIRNTCGYGLNALVDYSDPIDIIRHLLVGSEGTLAFIHRVTLKTSPVKPFRGTTMVSFYSLEDAMDAMIKLRRVCELYAGEFLDDISLRSLACLPGFPQEFRPQGESSDDCALLIEARAESADELAGQLRGLQDILNGYRLKTQLPFTTDAHECEKLWDIRRALFPALAGTRLPSEYAYVEDCCVPVEHLPEACHAFVDIMRSLGFTRSGVNGHALHGNLHCTIPLQISDPSEVEKLGEFIERTASVILRLGGSLKAEHGTGRAAASLVRREWGAELYEVMREIKRIFDPHGILNRGCLLTDDPRSHLNHLKFVDSVGQDADLCVDCGFCEAVCPSARQGFSPRQRIYALRAIASMQARGEHDRAAEWQKIFAEQGVALCATDGLCSTRCPLGINVAACMRGLRGANLSYVARHAGVVASRHVKGLTRTASAALHVWKGSQSILGEPFARISAKAVHAVTGMTIPPLSSCGLSGSSSLPAPSIRCPEKIVYFPSCAVRSMGYSKEAARDRELMRAAVSLMEKAGFQAVFPPQAETLCCGKAFETKGMEDAAKASAEALDKALLEASEGGRWPVMCDTSPCLARMKKTLSPSLSLYEPVEFALRFLAGRLRFRKAYAKIAVHATCSTREMGLADDLLRVARMCADEVVMPEGIFCCGFAGDKGFTRPQLNASALESLARQIAGCECGFSTSRTCEIGLTLHGGKPYRNILFLLDECS